ncbi:histidine kinase [Arenibacter sp. GZD96]|uniref:sensor histidine kinase n=1 Tax=Aurantibrevibacter litoralis TaxID=3106030 RepID=UPI002AFF8776|nr:histidine kinase [Arenibacter sp. GZD-96]MEA1784826.1 histidine kinase [Arenibacter sp. GZD-96]
METGNAATINKNPFLKEDNLPKYGITYKHHILFWAVYFLFNTLRWGSYFDDYSYSFKTNILSFSIHIALAYLNIYYLMPKWVYAKRYLHYAVAVFLCLVVALLLRFNLTYYLISPDIWPEGPEIIDHITLNYAVQMMLGELYVMSFVTAIKITIDRLQENKRLYDLEKRQLQSELKFLRSQVSPHFFFNTLNNIYSLTLEKSNKAPEVILKLSELMRYLLYTTSKPKQDLGSEIHCIQNYIELEKIRFDDRLDISMEITGDISDSEIAPMLLIPLVENAFKHGANKNLGNKIIRINIAIADGFLYFKISNTLPSDYPKTEQEATVGGIGLYNVKKRLQLGYAPNDYKLSIFEEHGMFHVILKLKVQ